MTSNRFNHDQNTVQAKITPFCSGLLIYRYDDLGLNSESADISIIRNEAASWRVNGWQFAPNLLTAFITKAGGYSPSSYDINLIKNSQLYRDTAQKYFQTLFEKVCTTGSTGATGTASTSAASVSVS